MVRYLRRTFTDGEFAIMARADLPLTGPSGIRRLLAERDIEYFARAYFPEYTELATPDIHRRMIGQIEACRRRALGRRPGLKLAMAIPRGHAKSFYFSMIAPIHAALFDWSPLTVIIGNTQAAAERLLGNIRQEIESNEAIIEDFGDVQGDVWQGGHAVISGNVIRAFGTGSGAIRGVSSPGQRPSLIVADDLDDDDLVRSPTQLDAAVAWWDKAVLGLGDQVAHTTSYVVVGTIIRRTSLLQHIIDSPDFHAIVEAGVTSFATNSQLWESWEAAYLAQARDGIAPARPEDDSFYAEHRESLLAGSACLWPRDDAYWHLMVYRLSRGRAAFASEIQNAPGTEDSHLGTVRRISRAEIIALELKLGPELELLGSLDPTTKGGKNNDLSAFVECLFDPNTKTLIVDYCDARQRNYNATVRDVTRRVISRGKQYDGFWCEDNVAIVSDLLQESLAKAGSFVVVSKVHNTTNKQQRIESLAEYTDRRQLRFADDLDDTIIRAYEEFPHGRFDDPIDALATMVLKLKERLNLI